MKTTINKLERGIKQSLLCLIPTKNNFKQTVLFLFLCTGCLLQAKEVKDSDELPFLKNSPFANNPLFPLDYKNLEFYAGVNFTSLTKVPSGYSGKVEGGFNLGVNYKYALDYHWAIVVGLEYSQLNSKVTAKDSRGEYETFDIEEEAFIFKYSSQKVTQKWNMAYLSIPVLVHYDILDQGKVYARTGFKFGMPLKNKVNLKVEDLQTRAYFPQYDVEFDQPLYLGFGDLGDWSQSSKQKRDFRFSYLLEVGTKIEIGNFDFIHVSLFMDVALSSQTTGKTNNVHLVEYQGIVENPIVLNSIYQANAKKFKAHNFGVKLSYSFGG
ncbi:porin family protein [Myroides sp. LJL116]